MSKKCATDNQACVTGHLQNIVVTGNEAQTKNDGELAKGLVGTHVPGSSDITQTNSHSKMNLNKVSDQELNMNIKDTEMSSK